ncbi:hypothetical protein DYB34_009242 [Aphanomyces astaci]|uniref:HTH CENPB-type domain-containing protein n=1 Tax=Aphanomyces astaci TaxID=112090 RepID=A0A418BEF1_APHAT|nr:hypothetical protein DYB34_009242 [Aphanomyces astaci]
MSTLNAPRKRGEGKRLTDTERLQILGLFSAPVFANTAPSNRRVAKQYGVSESAIRALRLKEAKIIERTNGKSKAQLDCTRRYATAAFPELETQLHAWLINMRRQKVSIPPNVVRHKAKSIANSFDPPLQFEASPGWLENYRRRSSVGITILHGEGGEVDKEDPELLAGLAVLSNIVATYPEHCVYNMDETGLFYRTLPRKTLLAPDESPVSTRGRKVPKDRVSLILCANSDGTHKIPITLVGKANEPLCVRGTSWPVHYFSQKKAHAKSKKRFGSKLHFYALALLASIMGSLRTSWMQLC